MADPSFARHPSVKPRDQNILLGGAYMLVAGACFATMMGMIRHLSETIHPFEIAFFRIFFGLLVMLPWIVKAGAAGLRTRRVGLYSLRAVTGTLALLCWFWAVTVVPLTEAVALSFTTPLFATLLAPLLLGEVVRGRRWIAVTVGLIGALVVLRPGLQVIQYPSLVILFGALMIAFSTIFIKMLSRTEPTQAIVAYMGIYLTPVTLIPALFVWVWPTWGELGLLLVLGAVATTAHLCFTRAFQYADASAVMPFEFSKLIFASLIGYFIFDQRSDLWTWVGAAIITAAVVYIAHRETVAQRRRRAAEAADPLSAARGDP